MVYPVLSGSDFWIIQCKIDICTWAKNWLIFNLQMVKHVRGISRIFLPFKEGNQKILKICVYYKTFKITLGWLVKPIRLTQTRQARSYFVLKTTLKTHTLTQTTSKHFKVDGTLRVWQLSHSGKKFTLGNEEISY